MATAVTLPLPFPFPPPPPPVPVSPFGSLSRSSFPDGFIFGTSSADYQFEGARYEGGRGESIWDIYCKKNGIPIANAINQYNKYKEDVEIMKFVGIDACRISIGWSRIFPNGNKAGGLNVEGLEYYRKIIRELNANGIEVYVTLLHFDYPQALEDQYGGFRSLNIVDDFRDFADICFMAFGDYVKKWVTLNEPWCLCVYGHGNGSLAPGRGELTKSVGVLRSNRVARLLPADPYANALRKWRTRASRSLGSISTTISGDPGIEPYLVGHNLLLAHAAAFELYKDKYQASQKGQIGITLNSFWYEPYTSHQRDIDASDRAREFMLGWFMQPITYGDYPEVMRTRVGARLPYFSHEQSRRLKGSYDFIGLNYYTGNYTSDFEHNPNDRPTVFTDPGVQHFVHKDGVYIGEPAIPSDPDNWIYVYPEGLKANLVCLKNKYKDPVIYITENGVSEENKDSHEINNIGSVQPSHLCDHKRVSFYYQHLLKVKEAIYEDHVNVRGYLTWSVLDNFEWSAAYTVRFGSVHVDFKNECLPRTLKFSAHWFKKLIERKEDQLATDESTNLDNITLRTKEPIIQVNSDPTKETKETENGFPVIDVNSDTTIGSKKIDNELHRVLEPIKIA